MLLCAYYLLRPLRDAMASGAVESLFSFYVGTFAVMLLLTPLFGALVSRVRKPLLLPITYAFFASNLLVFYVLFKLMPDSRGARGGVLRLAVRLQHVRGLRVLELHGGRVPR